MARSLTGHTLTIILKTLQQQRILMLKVWCYIVGCWFCTLHHTDIALLLAQHAVLSVHVTVFSVVLCLPAVNSTFRHDEQCLEQLSNDKLLTALLPTDADLCTSVQHLRAQMSHGNAHYEH